MSRKTRLEFWMFVISVSMIVSCKQSTFSNSTSENKCDSTNIRQSDWMYQYSVIDALLAGVFDGEKPLGELKDKGDFGLGTFNTLDGELLMLDGKIYKIKHTGDVVEAPDEEKTSLAFVKFFNADTTLHFTGNNRSFTELKELLVNQLDQNALYAFKINGTFNNMVARSVKAATPPYSDLSTYVEKEGGQVVFNFDKTTGTTVGFLLPAYMAKTNVPGFHFHYISEDKKRGGHVFDYTFDSLQVEIDYIKGFVVEPNQHPEFQKANMNKDRAAELERIE